MRVRLSPVLVAAFLAACGAGDGGGASCPTVDRGVLAAEDPEGNVTLYVSNQSFERSPVDIRVALDGAAVIDADLAVCTQHEFVAYRFAWAPGEHVVRATSAGGAADAERRVTVGAGRLWGYIGFSLDPTTGKGSFQFQFQDTELAFL